MRIEVYSRAQAGDQTWNAAVDMAVGAWWWHRAEWIDYALAYAPGSVDRSFVVAMDNTVVCAVPLVVLGRRTQNGGQPYAAAPVFLFEQNAPVEVAERAHREATRWTDDANLVMLRPMVPAQLARVPGAPPGLRRRDFRTHVVQLGGASEDALLASLRKSYRQAVRKAEEHYDVSVSASREAVALARALHVQAAGRETRSERTWELQAEWCEAGHGLVALARDSQHVPVGFAYAIRYRGWAYYASGAVSCDGVGHALQWALMRALNADGETAFYELGYDAGPEASEKERGIALFKSGFGGSLWTVPAIGPVNNNG